MSSSFVCKTPLGLGGSPPSMSARCWMPRTQRLSSPTGYRRALAGRVAGVGCDLSRPAPRSGAVRRVGRRAAPRKTLAYDRLPAAIPPCGAVGRCQPAPKPCLGVLGEGKPRTSVWSS
jgi:hypothetical protein